MPLVGFEPRYRQIMQSLEADINAGRFRAGQKLPSEAALVKKFDTSRITVGRALRELQSQGLIERRAGSGSFVREAVQPAPSLLFGLLIPDLGETDIFDPICHGLASAPETADHALLWGHTDRRDRSKEEQCWRLCQQFIARHVSGVFFAPLEFEVGAERSNRRVLAALKEAEVPVILLDRKPSAVPAKTRADIVGLNNRHAGYVATEHLIHLGCKQIGFLANQGAASTVAGRMAGYYDALRDNGLGDHLTEFVPGGGASADPLSRSGNKELEAFVCLNDQLASVLMQAFLARGMRIPEDVRLVGIDDVPYAKLLPVPLTTVRQPCNEIGQAAMRAMLERIRQPGMPAREILLEGELVVRKSCGASLA